MITIFSAAMPVFLENLTGKEDEQTKPLIDFYKKEGVLREVDGTQDLNDVFQAITEILGA